MKEAEETRRAKDEATMKAFLEAEAEAEREAARLAALALPGAPGKKGKRTKEKKEGEPPAKKAKEGKEKEKTKKVIRIKQNFKFLIRKVEMLFLAANCLQFINKFSCVEGYLLQVFMLQFVVVGRGCGVTVCYGGGKGCGVVVC